MYISKPEVYYVHVHVHVVHTLKFTCALCVGYTLWGGILSQPSDVSCHFHGNDHVMHT